MGRVRGRGAAPSPALWHRLDVALDDLQRQKIHGREIVRIDPESADIMDFTKPLPWLEATRQHRRPDGRTADFPLDAGGRHVTLTVFYAGSPPRRADGITGTLLYHPTGSRSPESISVVAYEDETLRRIIPDGDRVPLTPEIERLLFSLLDGFI